MKFLIDVQSPKKMCKVFQERGYDVVHTLDLPDKNRTKDTQLNQISLDQKRVLVSKDYDFIESLIISNKPYKLIYVSTGNITNKELLKIFRKNLLTIVEATDKNRLIEVTNQEIIIRF